MKLLLVSCFHIHQAYTITLTRYTHYIITTKFKLLFHFLIPMPIALINITIKQYGTTYISLFDVFQEEFVWWWHLEINFVCLFRRRSWSVLAIMYFPVKHKSQRLVPHWKGEVDAAILHFKMNVFSRSFSFHIYFESSVSCSW